MKAVQFSEYGGPEVLAVAEVDEPHAGAGQIRIAVKAAGVNPIDWKIRSGRLAQGAALEAPKIPGIDVAGVVDEVGDGVTGVSEGDEVFGFAVGGGTAEHAVVDHFAVKPADMPWAEAATLPVGVETAERVLDLLGLDSGQTLLVTGAAGGVGIVAVQFARARGARVIGTASEGNHEFLRELGAEPTTYGDGLVERVRELAPDGVDKAFDTAGRGALPDLIEITGSPDNVVTIADFSAAPELGVRVTTGSEAFHALGQAAELYEAGQFTMPIAQTFALDEVPEAHRVSEAGHLRGRLAITIN